MRTEMLGGFSNPNQRNLRGVQSAGRAIQPVEVISRAPVKAGALVQLDPDSTLQESGFSLVEEQGQAVVKQEKESHPELWLLVHVIHPRSEALARRQVIILTTCRQQTQRPKVVRLGRESTGQKARDSIEKADACSESSCKKRGTRFHERFHD